MKPIKLARQQQAAAAKAKLQAATAYLRNHGGMAPSVLARTNEVAQEEESMNTTHLYEWRVNDKRPWQTIDGWEATKMLEHYRLDTQAIIERANNGETVHCFVGFLRLRKVTE